jgi:hypothetical protein
MFVGCDLREAVSFLGWELSRGARTVFALLTLTPPVLRATLPDDDPPREPPPPRCASAANGRRARANKVITANILSFMIPLLRAGLALPYSNLTAWFCAHYTTKLCNMSIIVKNPLKSA